MNRYWFRPKRYGYGAVPSTWQGWLLTLLVVVLSVFAMKIGSRLFDDPRLAALASMTALAVLLGGFVWLVKLKTDGEWRWRNGEDD